MDTGAAPGNHVGTGIQSPRNCREASRIGRALAKPSPRVGAPDSGLAPGTRWADVPLSWRCPDCGAGKEDFEMVEV